MHKMDLANLRLLLGSALLLALTACATATPLPVTGGQADNALVKGTAPLAFMANTSAADIQAVDGIELKSSESSALVPPGHHSFSVRCSTPRFLGGMDFGRATLSFDTEAGHIYQFDSDKPEGDSKECVPYVYDSTDGREAYSETAEIKLDKNETSKWHGLDGNAHAGHTVGDIVPKGQNDKNWQQMIEIESWTKLMFPGKADAFFQQQTANAKKICPDTQVNVISEGPDDVAYEFEIPAACTGTDVRAQLGRFLTGKLGIYHVVFISRVAIQDTDRSKWLQALQGTTVVDEK